MVELTKISRANYLDPGHYFVLPLCYSEGQLLFQLLLLLLNYYNTSGCLPRGAQMHPYIKKCIFLILKVYILYLMDNLISATIVLGTTSADVLVVAEVTI